MTQSQQPPRAEEPRASGIPFYLACVALVAASAVVAAATRNSPVGMAAFLAGMVGAMIFLVLPSWLEHRAQVLDQLAVGLAELERRQYDLEAVRREHRKALARAEETQEQAAALVDRLEEQSRQLAELFRMKEELLASRQEGQRLQKRLDDWVQVLVDHCDDQHRLLSHDGVSPDYHAGVDRSLLQLTRALRSLGLDVVQPGPGDPFDDRLHRAAETVAAEDPAAHQVVTACLRPGYRRGESVLRRADVRLALPKNSQIQEVLA